MIFRPELVEKILSGATEARWRVARSNWAKRGSSPGCGYSSSLDCCICPGPRGRGSLGKELINYEIRVTQDANDRYGAFRVGAHEDLVTALGLATQEDRGGEAATSYRDDSYTFGDFVSGSRFWPS